MTEPLEELEELSRIRRIQSVVVEQRKLRHLVKIAREAQAVSAWDADLARDVLGDGWYDDFIVLRDALRNANLLREEEPGS